MGQAITGISSLVVNDNRVRVGGRMGEGVREGGGREDGREGDGWME